MATTQLDPAVLHAVRIAQLAGSARGIEDAATSGNMSDADVVQALQCRAALRDETPRVSDTGASLDDIAQDIVSHMNNSGKDAEFHVLETYGADSKRSGEASEVTIYNSDKLSIKLGRGKAESFLEGLRTFYP